MMPLALPAYLDLVPDQPELTSTVIAAVFSGAVFGDHCSPFSDTTIVSAFACGITPQEHVITQLPYALLAATVALAVGFAGIGAGLSVWFSLLLGALLLGGTAYVSTRDKPTKLDSPE